MSLSVNPTKLRRYPTNTVGYVVLYCSRFIVLFTEIIHKTIIKHFKFYSKYLEKYSSTVRQGFPGGASGKEPVSQCRRRKRRGFDPWVLKIPWRRAWQPTPVFLPGEFPWTEEPGRLQLTGSKELDTTQAT